MNVQELRQALKELSADEKMYSLDGSLKAEAVILSPTLTGWEVFEIDERFGIHDKIMFFSESDACENVLRRIKNRTSLMKILGYKY